ncbi:PDZ domain-containing protein [Enterococcus sp. PF1-24]|uniref:SepM family pheromone-processing serine protease n=1 Tax=unclassified Enterococcus TaxID=2608891 RepID=UPI0024753B84|nr:MULTISPECIES: SepM family pheromone-processing serine protease [unclassified Enterococcus]MDH6364229.1 PDZ domain-containing protein [Enterococcus sp. PFB1-1]MDH6401330.1 PDZ domain-containing protein [Enterococcus sp. PF1-24]
MKNKENKIIFTASTIGVVVLIVALVLTAIAALVPVPGYYVEAPGTTMDLRKVVTVDKEEDKEAGSFSLTAVAISKASALRLLVAQNRDFEAIITEEELTGGASSAEYQQIQEYYMVSSKNSAIQQAFELADVDYEMIYRGIYVMSIDERSNFKDVLSLGDTIIKADGKSFDAKEGFMDYVKNKKVGDEVTITFLHDGEEQEATGELIELTGEKKAGIGISLVDDNEIKSDTQVELDTRNIGGPSAGLMFTLEIYDLLTEGNLRHGKEIAGTGTISSDGTVGRIGGIDKKVASASKSGAEIFFAPDDELAPEILAEYPELQSNYQEALAAAEKLDTEMEIVPVKNVQDALDYLAKLD